MKILKVGSKDERLLGKYLTAAKPPELRIVVNTGGDSQEKRITLTAIGLRHPTAREAYFDLASKHNFRHVFPYMQLKAVLKP